MGRLTTHVLDTASGVPARAMTLRLFRCSDDKRLLLKELVTNLDGRCDGPLLEGDQFKPGVYEIEFEVADYFRKKIQVTEPAFLDVVPIRFGISDAESHYHVPLLVSPWSYSTYRGS